MTWLFSECVGLFSGHHNAHKEPRPHVDKYDKYHKFNGKFLLKINLTR